MAQLPPTYVLDTLRKLRGAAKVTYPLGMSLGDKRVERVVTVARGKEEIAWHTADEQYKECGLTFQQVVGFLEDQVHVEVYRRYDKLPTTPVVTRRLNGSGNPETVTTARVPIGTDPEAADFLTTQAEVLSDDGRVAQKVTAKVVGYVDQPGQDYDEFLGIIVPFVDKIVALGASIGAAGADITPQDQLRATRRVYNLAAVHTALDAYVAKLPGTVDVDLPDVLTGIDILWEEPVGDGTYHETGSGGAGGSSGSISVSRRGTAQGSVAVLPELKPVFAHKKSGSKRPCIDYYFFVPNNTSRAAIIAKLATAPFANAAINAWPEFELDEPTFILQGQKVSGAVNVNVGGSVSWSPSGAGYSTSSGTGNDIDYGPSIRPFTLRPCIHGAISLVSPLVIGGGTTMSKTATLHADATTGFSGTIIANSGSIDETITASGSVTPTSLSATNVTAIPSSGLYLLDLNTELYKHGYTHVMARVIDAADL